MDPAALSPTIDRCAGYTVVELLFAVGMIVTAGGMAVPQMLTGLDDYRAAAAARYVAARMQRARMDAVARSTEVAIQFVQTGSAYSYAEYVDGNGDGVHTRDVQAGIDGRLGPVERLGDRFSGVEFGALPGLPPVDAGSPPPGNDPIRLGASSLASFSASGTATSGSVYVRGRKDAQYVVRIYGATGRVRVLTFDGHARRWKPL
jgi:type II secretory pathway pseudopilin PulG